ncbi:hypothetical protein IWQ56_003168 [Coemansia nantahalensis]|uniref:Uncharacterized protein n=1 Tax=Coemansia nantahalensis TaxID=2789366 RepID=A0ACC1K205_9FUNG|nr:hypothetical protein IWQ56_003168 [Coemansia nantahalensis]KAJ2771718.1 hypothetical protein IWQ57_002087 [Coemansia nantahalensis]
MSGTDPGSRFITEAAIDEARKEREEAWKRAFEAGEAQAPAPDGAYDPRTLYERLQEQRAKKAEAYEESRRFASGIRKLDEDETEFLDTVDELEQQRHRARRQSESLALSQFKDKVAERRAHPASGSGTGKRTAAAAAAAVVARRAPSIVAAIGSAVRRRASPAKPAPLPVTPVPADDSGESSDSSESSTRRKRHKGSPGAPDPLGLLASYASDDSDSG